MDPVLKAIKEGDEEALKAMIKEGKNLAEPNKEGWLPLHEAAYYSQLSCLKALQQGEGGSGAARAGTGRRAKGSFLLQLRVLCPTTTLARGARQGYRPGCRVEVTKLGEKK